VEKKKKKEKKMGKDRGRGRKELIRPRRRFLSPHDIALGKKEKRGEGGREK